MGVDSDCEECEWEEEFSGAPVKNKKRTAIIRGEGHIYALSVRSRLAFFRQPPAASTPGSKTETPLPQSFGDCTREHGRHLSMTRRYRWNFFFPSVTPTRTL